MPYGIYLPGRWRSQPQGAVEIDWGHPLSRGLAMAVMPSARGVVLDAGRRRAILASTWTNADVLPGAIGIGVTASGGSGQTVFPAPVDFSSSGVSVVVLARMSSGAPNTYDAFVGIRSGIDCWFGQSSFGSGSNLGSSFAGVADVDCGVARPAAGALAGLSFVVSGSQITTGCYNVSTRATTTATTNPGQPRASASNEFSILGDTAAGASAAAGAAVYVALMYVRALGADETGSLRVNPWQILRPRRPIIYSLPSSTPVLSAATVIDIGSTSARPRVTITI